MRYEATGLPRLLKNQTTIYQDKTIGTLQSLGAFQQEMKKPSG